MLLTATSPIWCPDIITYIIPVCCIFLTHNTTGTFSVYFTSIICPIPHAGVKDFILILYLFKTPDIPTNHLIVRLNTIARRQAGAKIRAFATGRIIQIALYKSPFTGARGRQAFARATFAGRNIITHFVIPSIRYLPVISRTRFRIYGSPWKFKTPLRRGFLCIKKWTPAGVLQGFVVVRTDGLQLNHKHGRSNQIKQINECTQA